MPKISVISYFKDEEAYLEPMIQSVLDAMNMVKEPVELLLFDNGSTDGSRTIVESFSDPRIRLVTSDVDISGPDRNFAHLNDHVFGLARGELIALIGADDLAMPDRLALQITAFDADPLLDVCHSSAMHIDANANLLASRFTAHPYHAWNVTRILWSYLEIAFPTVMIRKSAWKRVGGFKDGGHAPDYWFFLNNAAQLRFKYLPETLLYYRVHDKSASHSPEGAQRTSEATKKIRADFRASHQIEDFFPEIILCKDQDRARCAALLELGNLNMAGGCASIALAFEEYKLADQILPDHPTILHNIAVILALDGQDDKAKEVLDQIKDYPLAKTASLVMRGLLPKQFTLASGRDICPELYQVPLPKGLWCSDGTSTKAGTRLIGVPA